MGTISEDVLKAIDDHLIKRTCQWCRWWTHSSTPITYRRDCENKLAECHCNPPVPGSNNMGVWPTTAGHQFCGEFERVDPKEI